MPCDSIHGTREARAEGHHAAAERSAIDRFDDQVRVIALQRMLHEAEAGTDASGAERALDLTHHRDRAQRGKAGTKPQRDVRGKFPKDFTRAMTQLWAITARLPPGTRASPAPGGSCAELRWKPGRSSTWPPLSETGPASVRGPRPRRSGPSSARTDQFHSSPLAASFAAASWSAVHLAYCSAVSIVTYPRMR